MEAVGEHFRGLIGAVEVRVAPWYGVRHVAHIRIHVQPEHRTCEITEKLQDDVSVLFLLCISPKLNVGRLLCR